MNCQVKFFPPQAISSSLAAAPSSTDLDKMRADLEEARRVIQAEHDLARRQMEEEKKELRRQLDDYRLVSASQKAGFALYMEQMEQEKERERKEKEEAEQRAKQETLRGMYEERTKKCAPVLVAYTHGKIPEVGQWVSTILRENSVLYMLQRISGECPWGFITSKGVFWYKSWDKPLVPLYTFQNDLTERDLILLDQLFTEPEKGSPYYQCLQHAYNSSSIITRMLCEFGNGPEWKLGRYFIEASKKFESVLRLIPGGYSNGKWQQLDGIFGMYYNPETNKLSDIPPELVSSA